MMEGWKEVRLTEFISFQRGFDLPREKFVSGEIPVYGSTSILGYHNQAKAKGPGIITGRSGTIGVFQFTKENYWPHNTTLWVKDFKNNLPEFAFYLLKCLDFKMFNSGGAVPTLNRNVLGAFKVKVPPIHTQQKIASILSAYDDLIENNLKRIKLLEEMAQQTYEEWFVRMRFPGYEHAVINEETGLPEGWEKVKLETILEANNGKSFKGEYLEYNQLPVYGSNGIIGQSKLFNCENSIIIGRVGAYCGATRFCKGKYWATDNTITISSIDRRMPNYLAYYILKGFNLRNLAGGAAQPLLTQRLINNLELLAPSKQIATNFNSNTELAFDSILNLQNQNQRLKEARDILLPRLMSGMIEV